jgi:hypothetical protein
MAGTVAFMQYFACCTSGSLSTTAENVMSKGMNQKKAEKKKPAKTMKEKRAEKSAKRAAKSGRSA